MASDYSLHCDLDYYGVSELVAGMVFNGSITDFQSDGTGSNPVTRSKCVRSSTVERWVVAPHMTVQLRPYTPFAGVAKW